MKQGERHCMLNLNLRECCEMSQPGRDMNIPAQSVFRSKQKGCGYQNTVRTAHRMRTKIMSQRSVKCQTGVSSGNCNPKGLDPVHGESAIDALTGLSMTGSGGSCASNGMSDWDMVMLQ